MHVITADGGEGRVRRLADHLEVPVLVQLSSVARILHPLSANTVVHLRCTVCLSLAEDGDDTVTM